MWSYMLRSVLSLLVIGSCFTFEVAFAEPLKIITLGDSITKGVRSGVTANETFAAELQRQLRVDGHPDVEVINVGIGGEMAGQGLLRLERDVVSRNPRIVTIMYGHNDSYVDVGKTMVRVPIPRFRADLSQLVNRLRASNMLPILMTPPAYAEKSGPNGAGEHCNIKLSQYAEITRQVAQTLQVPLVEHFTAWEEISRSGTDLNEWTTDGYHPNPTGHVDLARRMLPVVSAQISTALQGGMSPWPDLPVQGGVARRGDGLLEFTQINRDAVELRFPRLNNVVKSVAVSAPNEPAVFLAMSQTPTEWTIPIPDTHRANRSNGELTVHLLMEGMPRLCLTPAISHPGAEGVIVLSAKDAIVHGGDKLQFEPLTHKNTIGYWVNPREYAQWSYKLDQPGQFHVEIMQGCGGHAGSDVELNFPDGVIPFVVAETGHFQNFVWRRIGQITLSTLGIQTMSLRCKQLAKGAVMDMRQVRLVPVSLDLNIPREMRDVEPDLVPPAVTNSASPRPGSRQTLGDDYSKEGHFSTMYLPTDWTPDRTWPILVELTGNGGYRDDRGDVCSGASWDGQLAYGITGGYGAICLSVPFMNEAGTSSVSQWWGDPPTYNSEETLLALQQGIQHVSKEYGGDSKRVILVGFSRGSIAVNAIGLSTDQASGLWKAAVCFSHYDGVQEWPVAGSDAVSSLKRLERLGNKPQFLISESARQEPAQVEQTRSYLEKTGIRGEFTFATTGFLNHSDQWALRPSPARTKLREWLAKQMLP